MKKSIIGFTILVFFVCALSACVKGSYEFLNDESEISTIEIVRLCEYDRENNCFKEQLISTVQDHSAFLSDFRDVKCNTFFGDPRGVYEGDIVVKITYDNGEYELIRSLGRGFYSFDQEQFNDLIEKYSRETAQKQLLLAEVPKQHPTQQAPKAQCWNSATITCLTTLFLCRQQAHCLQAQTLTKALKNLAAMALTQCSALFARNALTGRLMSRAMLTQQTTMCSAALAVRNLTVTLWKTVPSTSTAEKTSCAMNAV